MKTEPKPWAVGDACPNGCGQLVAVPAALPAMRERAADKDANAWQPVPPTHDSASDAFIQEHGSLFRCPTCDYKTRADVEQADAEPAAPAAGGRGRGKTGATTGD